MFSKPTICPICKSEAQESPVPEKLDSRIQCPRCGTFDSDHRATINLTHLQAPNWVTLSGLARHSTELDHEILRLVWTEIPGDREGKYEFQGHASDRISAQEKVNRFLGYLAVKTDRTAGEILQLQHPDDLSVAFARSIDELGAILKQLEKQELIEVFRKSPDQFDISLTIEGADRVSGLDTSVNLGSTEGPNVEITGPPKGSGAFGRVYPGIQLQLGRQVAIKIIELHVGPDAVAHAKGLAKVQHPNVVTVHDVGRVLHPTTGEIVDCVVMELIEGERLPDTWATLNRTQLPAFCRQIVEGVKAMHDANVCHHDLHAGNVLVSGNNLKIIDIHYTETARLSHASSMTEALLKADDWRRAAGICRQMYWMGNRDALTPVVEDRFNTVESLEELETVLTEVEQPQSSNPPTSLPSVDERLEGLSELDSRVLRLAGDQLTSADRSVSRISVPQIVEKIGDYGQVNSSLRLLVELRYIKQSGQDNPRYVMMTTYGFDQYLQVFRGTYGREQNKICMEIVRQERCRDLDIVAITEVPRPIVEHVINVLTTNGLIDSSRYNTGLHINSVSEQLRRMMQGD